MIQYIDKSAVVAEIKKHQAIWDGMDDDYCKGQRLAYSDVISFLDTLETKEVDLDNELDFVKDAYYYFTSDERGSMKKVAKHFFELGLKAQKGRLIWYFITEHHKKIGRLFSKKASCMVEDILLTVMER